MYNWKPKKALIIGITGQDGSYLAELLIKKGYEVHGIKRRSSTISTERIDHLFPKPHSPKNFRIHYGDLSDALNLIRLLKEINPDEIYNLGAQSHVAVSFKTPLYTADIDGLGTLRILEAIRTLGLEKKIRFYQASTSELFGLVQESPQSETTPFYPRSPYGVAKIFSYWSTVNYREAYGLYACNGILFNHESPRRGETFVTRKITRELAKVVLGLKDCLRIGNIEALRDWGHAKDYVEMQWLMLQQEEPDDFVIATGKQHSVREFIIWAAKFLGISIEFHGKGLEEVGVISKLEKLEHNFLRVGDVIIRIDPEYYRPAEVQSLLGDSSKAMKKLGWKPTISAKELCEEMMEADFNLELKKTGKTQQHNLSIAGLSSSYKSTNRSDLKIL